MKRRRRVKSERPRECRAMGSSSSSSSTKVPMKKYFYGRRSAVPPQAAAALDVSQSSSNRNRNSWTEINNINTTRRPLKGISMVSPSFWNFMTGRTHCSRWLTKIKSQEEEEEYKKWIVAYLLLLIKGMEQCDLGSGKPTGSLDAIDEKKNQIQVLPSLGSFNGIRKTLKDLKASSQTVIFDFTLL